MAETLTVDPNPPAEVVGEQDGVQLTADEQDSLAVGEQIVDQQEKLLAGKYKDAEELEKAYINLQKKLGEDGKEETSKAETEQEEVLPETPEEDTQNLSPTAQLITSASDEFDNNGQLTPETLNKLASMPSKDLVEAYMQLQANQTEAGAVGDITDAQVNEIKTAAGGEEAYNQITDWASNNLQPNEIAAFDEVINSGSIDAIKLAVSGLKAEYEKAVGYEGRMVTGKGPINTKDVYRSQAELVAAMGDPRYENDPAYRQDIIEKLGRSDNLQF